MKSPCVNLALAAVLCGLWVSNARRSPAGLAAAGDERMTFVYVHGFGGAREDPKFCRNMRGFLEEAHPKSKIINYEWDSVEVDPLRAGASWEKAQRRADEEAVAFKTAVIEKLEAEGRPYALVGFSVGSRVVLRALERCDAELQSLAGVYFLGSAMTKDTTLAKKVALPDGMKITNYHSPLRDKVHAIAFNFMSETPAGGQDGFDDTAVFENLAVSCSHAHKGVGVSIDYSGLAEAIGAIELYQQGVRIPGETNFNIKTAVGGGSVWWNKVMRLEAPTGGRKTAVEIEQHTARPGYYRALRVDSDGGRERVARGSSLHAILVELGVDEGGHARQPATVPVRKKAS